MRRNPELEKAVKKLIGETFPPPPEWPRVEKEREKLRLSVIGVVDTTECSSEEEGAGCGKECDCVVNKKQEDNWIEFANRSFEITLEYTDPQGVTGSKTVKGTVSGHWRKLKVHCSAKLDFKKVSMAAIPFEDDVAFIDPAPSEEALRKIGEILALAKRG